MKFVAREHRRHRIEPAAPLLIVNRIPGILRDLGQDEAILAPAIDRIVASMLADRTNEAAPDEPVLDDALRSEEHTSELQSLMRISYAVFCLKKKTSLLSHLPAHINLLLTKIRFQYYESYTIIFST